MRMSTNISFKKWQILPRLSLTPALSRWERGNRSPTLRETEHGDSRVTFEKPASVRLLFPLPAGICIYTSWNHFVP